MSRLLVVGAGISGLAAAILLDKEGHDVTVWERADAPGGNVRTDRVDGRVLDRAANGWLDNEPEMQKLLNLKVKNRESFRPFAPAALEDKAAEWFEIEGASPYMLLTVDVRPDKRHAPDPGAQSGTVLERVNRVRSDIPAVTHVDYSARLQTVSAKTNPRFHRLLQAFYQKTGCPVLVNTSFNVRGEPIVCTPEDAFRCFMGTEIDMLVAGTSVLHKAAQDPGLQTDYKLELEPD